MRYLALIVLLSGCSSATATIGNRLLGMHEAELIITSVDDSGCSVSGVVSSHKRLVAEFTYSQKFEADSLWSARAGIGIPLLPDTQNDAAKLRYLIGVQHVCQLGKVAGFGVMADWANNSQRTTIYVDLGWEF